MTQVVPNWNDPNYLDAFGQLLAALGRRYDGDERLSVWEFSGYGDFSENHIAYLRDKLDAPGPAPDDSVAKLGYYSQFRDQSITIASIRQLVAANVDAFPHTQVVVTPQNPEIVRELLADDVTKKLSAPVGIRSDCLGVYAPLPDWASSEWSPYVKNKDPLVAQLTQRLAAGPGDHRMVLSVARRRRPAALVRESPPRCRQVPRVDDIERQLPREFSDLHHSDGPQAVPVVGERQRLRRLPVFGGRSARVGGATRRCGDHRCDLDQLRLGRCH